VEPDGSFTFSTVVIVAKKEGESNKRKNVIRNPRVARQKENIQPHGFHDQKGVSVLAYTLTQLSQHP
jgi:hypothetical protein